MIEVAELITSGRQVVLVLQDVPMDAVINNHVSGPILCAGSAPFLLPESFPLQTLPQDEVKDLNRGRAYLANVADRHDVTVFQSLDVALQEAFVLIQQRRAERAAQFIGDEEDGAGGVSDSDATGPDLPALPPPLPQQQQPEQPHPVAKAGPTPTATRPSITSALADLASQFVQDGYGVDDAISEDDEEDRRDDDEDVAGVAAPVAPAIGALTSGGGQSSGLTASGVGGDARGGTTSASVDGAST